MREEVLAALLAADKELSRDEPEVEANLGIQMEHMGLETWSISVRRRIRDTVLRLNPNKIIFAGAGIGHLSSWILHHLSENDSKSKVQLIEEGNRFAVILKRLCDRYESVDTNIVVGSTALLAGELIAWKITKSGNPPIFPEADAIIVNSPMVKLADDVEVMLKILNKNGILLTIEPTPPVGDRDTTDPEVVGFNKWMELIKSTSDTHHLAFAPLFGGTIVAWFAK